METIRQLYNKAVKRPKRIVEILSDDGSIDMELLKGISRGCLERLQQRHVQGIFLGNFRPAQIFYEKFDGKIEIEFREQKVKSTLNVYRLSELMWMAPEMLKKISKPTADSDVFTLGLLFHFLLTNGANPMAITSTLFKSEIKIESKISLKLLDALTKDTDTILFIDLIKRMIQEVPDQRETCEDLVEHAALKSKEERLQIIKHLAEKCFDGDKCKNEYLVKVMNKKKVHMEGSLGEDSAEFHKLLAEISKLPNGPDIKTCSSLLKTFALGGFQDDEFKKHRLEYLSLIMAVLPNFFPHLYNIYREELPKVYVGTFKEIFKHFNDAENSLGTGSYGTIVYRGKFGEREIAIKRVLKSVSSAVEREISIMMKIDRHPNILKYFAKEEDENFIYIGTELCEGNLATFVQDKTHNMRQKITTKEIFQQTADGLNYLHQMDIIHRDIKPENILICHDNETYSVKLADFGISKPLNPKTALSTVNINIPGTIAWIAPEVGEKGHAKSSDIFSMGCVFYFVILDGSILWQELNMSYSEVELQLANKLQESKDQGNCKEILQMDLLTRILKLNPELRPSAKKMLSHPLFWEDKICLNFILDIRKKFDVLDPKFVRKIKNEHQKILDETPTVLKLKVALDLDKTVVQNDWIAKLDTILAEEFNRGYDKESVSDLLRAMRNKWMHKEELKDTIKDLFGEGTESNFLSYFTSKYPRLLVYCYNAVEKEARDLLAEYFYQDTLAQARIVAISTQGPELEGSKLTIRCKDVIAFPEWKIDFISLKIEGISRLLVEENKSFNNFLQRNGTNVTRLEFFEGSLKIDSVNKILLKLPNLKEINFGYDVEYEIPKTNQTIQTTTCRSLENLVILSSESLKLLQAFQECQTIQKLTVNKLKVTLDVILQKFANLEELKVVVDENYPVSLQHEANLSIRQLKVLSITFWPRDEKIHENIHEKLVTFIQKQNNLQEFYFYSYSNSNPSQTLYSQLAAHIYNLKLLTILEIEEEQLLQEVEALVANSQVANTRLEEFSCQPNFFKSPPSSFLGHFTNLRKLHFRCSEADKIIVEDLISFMNRTQLTLIKLWCLPIAYFQLLKKLHVPSLQVFRMQIYNDSQDRMPTLEILQEILSKHPNVTHFEIGIYKDHDEPKSLELIPMIVAALTKLDRLEVWGYRQITANVINQIGALKTLKYWKINDLKSETFYLT